MGEWFDELWNEPRRFILPETEEDPYCPYAREFKAWIEDLEVSLRAKATVVTINQAKILVLDKYMAWREAVPRDHQRYTGPDHCCIYHVFEEMYQKLKAAELALTPPMLFLPESRVHRRQVKRLEVPQIMGISIGESDEER